MKFLTLPLLLISLNSFAASGFEGCGTYAFKGKVTIKEEKMNLFIHEGTKSELKFHLKLQQEGQLAPYLNKQVEGKIQITKLMDGTLATEFRIIDAKRAGINPLHPDQHSFLKKIDSKKCE